MTIPVYDFDAMQLRVQHARAAIFDVRHLERAFLWEKTPQGKEYWEQQAANGLDLTARATLAFMVAQSICFELSSGFMWRAA